MGEVKTEEKKPWVREGTIILPSYPGIRIKTRVDPKYTEEYCETHDEWWYWR